MQHAIEVAAPKADRVSVAKDVADAVGPKADKKYVDDVVRVRACTSGPAGGA